MDQMSGFRNFHVFFFLVLTTKCVSQDLESATWNHQPPKYKEVIVPKQFGKENIVVINEKVDFNFCSTSHKTLQKTVLLKILTDKGSTTFSVSLPESFDIAENQELRQQGRLSKNKIPFIQSYNLEYFLARIIKPNGKVINVKPKYSSTKIRWIKPTGEYVDDYINWYAFPGLQTGDLLEYTYSTDYQPNYGSDIIYLSSKLSKLNIEYSFRYLALAENKNYKYLFLSNIPDSCVTTLQEKNKDGVIVINETIKLSNLQRINYFIHASPVQQLPFVYFNMNYSIKQMNFNSYAVASVPDFKWTSAATAANFDARYNIKKNTDIRKFLDTQHTFENDSTHIKFLTALNDTLNSFRYYSSNYLFYNDPRLYSLYSGEHLLKRRIAEYHIVEVYENILNQKDIFHYVVKVQDNRLGALNPLVRIGLTYENILIAVPFKHSYFFVTPRYNGLKYFINEMPFYYEGTTAALFPSNYQPKGSESFGKQFKFVKTAASSAEDNVRIENCVVKIIPDSLKLKLELKESLSGQFSTLLRPYYLNEAIDSTVNIKYFKKFTDKPFGSGIKISYKSQNENFPFRCSFDASENIQLKSPEQLDLSQWFSFFLDSTIIDEEPTHDFYFDFPFTDIYNFIFKRDKPINTASFNKSVKNSENDYFAVNSSLKKTGEDYVLSITVKIKKKVLPKSESKKLIEFIDDLKKLNSLKLKFT